MLQNKDQTSKDYMKNIVGTKKNSVILSAKKLNWFSLRKWNFRKCITESRKLEIIKS